MAATEAAAADTRTVCSSSASRDAIAGRGDVGGGGEAVRGMLYVLVVTKARDDTDYREEHIIC